MHAQKIVPVFQHFDFDGVVIISAVFPVYRDNQTVGIIFSADNRAVRHFLRDFFDLAFYAFGELFSVTERRYYGIFFNEQIAAFA